MNYNTVIITINDRPHNVIIANDTETRERGLMFVRTLPSHIDGMLFLFDDFKPRAMWNKNTYIDIDIFWINGNKIVGVDVLPSCLTTKGTIIYKQSNLPVNIAVELIKK